MKLIDRRNFSSSLEVQQALSHVTNLLNPSEQATLAEILDAAFEVRARLVKLERQGQKLESVEKPFGLSPICITANEEYLLPALSKFKVAKRFQIQLYEDQDLVEKRLPRIHAFTTIEFARVSLIIDVNADCYYGFDTGVIVSERRQGLYSSGKTIYVQDSSHDGRIGRFTFHTWDGRPYLTASGISFVSVKPLFFEDEANLCPLGLSANVTLYQAYSRMWAGRDCIDSVKLLLATNSTVAVENINFYNVFEAHVNSSGRNTILSVKFLDGSKIGFSVDECGAVLECDWPPLMECKLKKLSISSVY